MTAAPTAAPTRHVDPVIQALIDRRHALDLSQFQVAERMGRDAGQISGYERGANTPGLRVLADWAAALGVELTVREAGTDTPARSGTGLAAMTSDAIHRFHNRT